MKKKFYKACLPLDTIHRIRDILHHAKIFVSESSNSHDEFYHSHLWLSNEGVTHLGITTNGKGINPQFSLASAYAELMERLQNNLKLHGERYSTRDFLETLPEGSEYRKRLEEDGSVLDYVSFSDEVYISYYDLLLNENNACYKLYGIKNIDYLKKKIDLNNKELCIPYYNVFKNRTEYLPVKNAKTGSNGMCAGNTAAEALVQGICEIFERFVIKNVLLNKIILPQIPLEEFIDTEIYKKILKLRENRNLEVIILDGSLNFGLPVIGTLIIDKSTHNCRLEMGGATDPEIALERCLTEHFQGYNPLEYMHNINHKFQYLNRSEIETDYINFYHQMIDGDAELNLPVWITKEPSYTYNGLTYIGGNNHNEELRELLELISKNNFELYVRDNSILGFPSYHVYIPGMSEIFSLLNEDDIYTGVELLLNQWKLLNIKNQTNKSIHSIAPFIDQIYGKVRSVNWTIESEFLFNNNKEIEDIDKYLFLATLFYYDRNIKKTIKYLGAFIEDVILKDKNVDLSYYYCAKQYLEFKMKFENNIAIQKLKQLYCIDIVEAVVEDLEDPDKAFQYYNLPTCFECEKCPIKIDCRHFDVMKLAKKIHDYSRKDIDQMKIAELFV